MAVPTKRYRGKNNLQSHMQPIKIHTSISSKGTETVHCNTSTVYTIFSFIVSQYKRKCKRRLNVFLKKKFFFKFC